MAKARRPDPRLTGIINIGSALTTAGKTIKKTGGNKKPTTKKNVAKPAANDFEFTSVPAALFYSDGKGGVVKDSKFELPVTEVTTGYGAKSQTLSSRFYERVYYKSFDQKPIHVTGRVRDEDTYDALYRFIQIGSRKMVTGSPRMRMIVPSAKIAVWGFITRFRGGHTAQGFEVAPQFEFDFIVTLDKRISRSGAVSNEINAYFFSPNDKYWKTQQIVDLGKLTDSDLMTRSAADSAATAQPTTPSGKKPPPDPNDPNFPGYQGYRNMI